MCRYRMVGTMKRQPYPLGTELPVPIVPLKEKIHAMALRNTTPAITPRTQSMLKNAEPVVKPSSHQVPTATKAIPSQHTPQNIPVNNTPLAGMESTLIDHTAKVMVQEESPEKLQSFYRSLITRALPVDESVNNNNYINTGNLFAQDHFYILGAEESVSTLDSTKLCARIRVLVEKTAEPGQYEECLWTPSLSPERSRLCAYFLKNPQSVVGPVHLEGVDTGFPNQYMRIVNNEPEPF